MDFRHLSKRNLGVFTLAVLAGWAMNKIGFKFHEASAGERPVPMLLKNDNKQGEEKTAAAHEIAFKNDRFSFSHEVNDLANGRMLVRFKPEDSVYQVNLHYKINNGDQVLSRMINQDTFWSHTIRNLEPGTNLVYWFTFTTSFGKKGTSPIEHLYQASNLERARLRSSNEISR